MTQAKISVSPKNWVSVVAAGTVVLAFAGALAYNGLTGKNSKPEFKNTPAAVETIQGKERANIPFNGGKGVVTGISITATPVKKKSATIMEALEAVQAARENAMEKCDAKGGSAADLLDPQ